MIFESIEDIQRVFAGPSVNNDFNTIAPYLDDAKSNIIPFIGLDFYEAIATDLNSSDETIQKIIKLMRKPIAHFAYLAFGIDGTMQIDDSGFHRVETADQKSAYQWQMLRYDKGRTLKAWEGVEELINGLELLLKKENPPEVLTKYSESDERKYIKSFLIWKTTDWRKYRKVESFYTIQVMLAGMTWVQNNVITANIGQELATSLFEHALTDAFTDDEKMLLPFIKEAIVNLTINRTVEDGLLDNSEMGLTVRSVKSDQGVNVTQAEIERIAWLKASSEKDGLAAIKKLRDYLNANASAEKYSSYFNSSLYINPAENREPRIIKNNPDSGAVMF